MMIVNNVNIFILILSILTIIKYVFIIFAKLLENDLDPLKLTNKEEIMIFFSLSYIITNIII